MRELVFHSLDEFLVRELVFHSVDEFLVRELVFHSVDEFLVQGLVFPLPALQVVTISMLYLEHLYQ